MGANDKVLLALKVWVAAAWADGVISKQEADGVRAVIETARLTDAERKTARSWLDKKLELDDINVSQIAPDDRANIFAAALGVVAIDDEVVAAEHRFLERLQIALQIDDKHAAEIRKQAGI